MARPRQFDEQLLLDAATDLFWSQGFDGTSIEDVSARTAVGNGSIYAAYGSKMGLFLAVFERYCDRRAAFVEAVLSSSEGSARDAAACFFDAIISDCAGQPDRRGCLMVNTVTQMGHRVPEVLTASLSSTTRMERSLERRLLASLPDSPVDVSALSAHLVLVAQGLIQLSRLGVPRERLDEIAAVSCDTMPEGIAA